MKYYQTPTEEGWIVLFLKDDKERELFADWCGNYLKGLNNLNDDEKQQTKKYINDDRGKIKTYIISPYDFGVFEESKIIDPVKINDIKVGKLLSKRTNFRTLYSPRGTRFMEFREGRVQIID